MIKLKEDKIIGGGTVILKAAKYASLFEQENVLTVFGLRHFGKGFDNVPKLPPLTIENPITLAGPKSIAFES